MSSVYADLDDEVNLDVNIEDDLPGAPTLAQRLRMGPLPDLSHQFGNQRESTRATLGPHDLNAYGQNSGYAMRINDQTVAADLPIAAVPAFVEGVMQSADAGGIGRVQSRVDASGSVGDAPKMLYTDYVSQGNASEQLPETTRAVSGMPAFGEGPSIEQRSAGFVEESEEISDLLKCANCKRWGHTVAKCIQCDFFGFVRGCANCNTRGHMTEACPNLPDNEAQRDSRLYQWYVVGRANLPPLVARHWNWAQKASQMGMKNNVGWPLTRKQAYAWMQNHALGVHVGTTWDYAAMVASDSLPLGVKSSAHRDNLTTLSESDVLLLRGGAKSGKRLADASTTNVNRPSEPTGTEAEDDEDMDVVDDDEDLVPAAGSSKSTTAKRRNTRRGGKNRVTKPRYTKPAHNSEAFRGNMHAPSQSKLEERKRRFGGPSRERDHTQLDDTRVSIHDRFRDGVIAKDKALGGVAASSTNTDTGEPESSATVTATAAADDMDYERYEQQQMEIDF